MANIFNSVLAKVPNRTTFDKSFKNKTTANIGQLFPIFCEEIVPSQRIKLSQSHFVRVQPMLAPIFDNVKFKQYYFFIPNRLLTPKWEEFRTGGPEQNFGTFNDLGYEYGEYLNMFNSSSFTQNQINEIKKLLRYFNIPSTFIDSYIDGGSFDMYVNSLPINAYFRVIFDYFIDEQKDSDIYDKLKQYYSFNNNNFDYYEDFFNCLSALDSSFHYLFRKRYGHDYFTSATESPQLGQAIGLNFNPNSLSLTPLTGIDTINIPATITTGSITGTIPENTNEDIFLYRSGGSSPVSQAGLYGDISGQRTPLTLLGTTNFNSLSLEQLTNNIRIVGNSDLFTINDLRNSFLLQELLEKNNVSGFRYFEWIKSHFGLSSPDSSLQRSQFICSVTSNINFVEVEQNTPANDVTDTPQGNLAGRGVGGDASFIIDREFTEDGFLIGLGCFIPEHTYNQGMPKMFIRQTGLDYLIPHFERLGEQPVLNGEIFWDNGSSDAEVFGYQSRYAEYKSRYNTQSGDFDDSLDFWTLTRKFENLPTLNSDFLQINFEDFQNAFAVQDDSDKFLLVQAFNLEETLPLSRYATPAQL